MTDKPSIERLREFVEYGIYGTTEANTALHAALTELDALHAENESLKAELKNADEVELAHVADVNRMIAQRNEARDERDAERARADALGARVEALTQVGNEMLHQFSEPTFPGTECRQSGHVRLSTITAWKEFFNSTPSADLSAHDARVRREEREAAAKKCAEAYWAMVAPKDHAAMHPTIEFWRDALGLEPMSSAEHEALAAIEPRHPEIVMVDDLAMLVRLLVHSIRKHSPDNETARKAMDYLRRHEL